MATPFMEGGRMNKNERCLWRFCWNVGRGYSVESVFLATPQEVEDVIGKTVYFGEVCGKHSDVEVEMEEEDFNLLTNVTGVVEAMDDVCQGDGCTISGHNPLVYYREQKEDEDDYHEE